MNVCTEVMTDTSSRLFGPVSCADEQHPQLPPRIVSAEGWGYRTSGGELVALYRTGTPLFNNGVTMNYWHECIAEACSEAGVIASDEQVKFIAEWVAGAHENYGTAMGHDVIGNPLVAENKSLVAALDAERAKRICRKCNGEGQLYFNGPHHSSAMRCDICQGEGKI